MGAFTEDWLREHQAKIARGRNTVPAPAPRLIDRDRPSAGCPVVTDSPKAKQKIERPEQALQLLVAQFLDWALPEPLKWLHIPNGEKRDPIIAAILKAMGTKPGAADVLILGWQGGRFIWIELKSDNGSLTKHQREWRDWCRAIGAPWFLCRSLDDVIEALTSLQIRLRVRA